MIYSVLLSYLLLVVVLLLLIIRGRNAWIPVFMILIIMMPIVMPSTASNLFLRGSVYRILGIILIIVLFIQSKNSIKIPEIGPIKYYLFFIASCCLSALFSISPIESLFRCFSYAEPLIWFFIALAVSYNYSEGFEKINKALMISLIFVLLIGSIQIVLQKDFLASIEFTQEKFLNEYVMDYIADKRTFSGRITASLGQPVYTAFFFIAVSVVPLYYFLTQNSNRLVYLLIILLLTLNIYTTGTRASYPVILFILLALILKYGIRNPRLIIFIVILVTLFGGFIITNETIDFLKQSYDISHINEANINTFLRIELTLRLLKLGLEKPFLGNGPGIIQKSSTGSEVSYMSTLEGLSGQENHFLVIFADTGFVGLFVYILFLIKLIKMLLKKVEDSENDKIFRFILLIVTIGFFAGSATVANLNTVPMIFLLILYGGFLGSQNRKLDKRLVNYDKI